MSMFILHCSPFPLLAGLLSIPCMIQLQSIRFSDLQNLSTICLYDNSGGIVYNSILPEHLKSFLGSEVCQRNPLKSAVLFSPVDVSVAKVVTFSKRISQRRWASSNCLATTTEHPNRIYRKISSNTLSSSWFPLLGWMEFKHEIKKSMLKLDLTLVLYTTNSCGSLSSQTMCQFVLRKWSHCFVGESWTSGSKPSHGLALLQFHRKTWQCPQVHVPASTSQMIFCWQINSNYNGSQSS